MAGIQTDWRRHDGRGGVVETLTPTDALALGWSIIPVGSGKRPMIRSWKAYQTRPPTEAELSEWLKLQPPAWGMVTGAISKRIVLDFDGKPGRETMQKLELAPHRRTGSGGYHVDFKHPGWYVPTLNSKSKRRIHWDWRGLDIRGDGGYAVFTGRNHAGTCRWLRDAEPYELDLLPSDLRKILGLLDPPTPRGKLTSGTTPRPSTETSARKGDLISRALSRVSSEGRNNAGFWLACQLRDNGYFQAEAETRMREYADAVPATNMKGQAEPYTHTEALTSLQQAYAAPRREPWPMKPPTEPGPSIHAEPEHKPQPEVARLPSNQPRSRQRFTITPALGLELYQMEHREPPWVVKDLIHTGETLLCGREKTGKSHLALQLALDVVLERRALGKFDLVKPGRALFFALEDVPRRITRRLKQLLPAPTSEEMQLL